MQKPSNLKHAKSQKGRLNFAIRLDRLCYGDFALMANQPARLNASQLSAAILAIKRLLKKEGSPILRLFTHTPVSREYLKILPLQLLKLEELNCLLKQPFLYN